MLDTDILSQKRMPNSFSTTIETTTYRGHVVEETPGTSSNMRAALRGVEYIAQHIKNQDKDNEVSLKFLVQKYFKTICTLLVLAKKKFNEKLIVCYTGPPNFNRGF